MIPFTALDRAVARHIPHVATFDAWIAACGEGYHPTLRADLIGEADRDRLADAFDAYRAQQGRTERVYRSPAPATRKDPAMPTPFNFAADAELPPALAARMQAAADARAAAGLISADGQTHISAECRDLYDAGHSVLSTAYSAACRKARAAR